MSPGAGPGEGPRIVLLGASGSGKTRLAELYSTRCGCTHVELDQLRMGPSSRPLGTEEFRGRVEAAISGDRWIVDGAYLAELGDLVLRRATLVLWLDVPARRALPQLVGRELRNGLRRVEPWAGWPAHIVWLCRKLARTTRARRADRRSMPAVLTDLRRMGTDARRVESSAAADRVLAELSGSR